MQPDETGQGDSEGQNLEFSFGINPKMNEVRARQIHERIVDTLDKLEGLAPPEVISVVKRLWENYDTTELRDMMAGQFAEMQKKIEWAALDNEELEPLADNARMLAILVDFVLSARKMI